MKKRFCSFVFLCLLLMLSACGDDNLPGYTIDKDSYYTDDSPVALVVISGNHANAMAVPGDAYKYIEDSLEHVVYGGYCCAIVSDATPTKVELKEADFFVEDARNTEVLKQRINKRKSELINTLQTLDLSADTPEVDLLAAIREATNVLSSARAKDIPNKQIMIIDTGISTTGDLNLVGMNFLNGMPDIKDIITKLQSYEGVGVLPDLTGISVTFIGTSDGLAEVASPQLALTTDKIYIKKLWTEVVQACGAANVQFVSAAGWDTPNIYTEDAESEFPYVSTIIFHHEPIIDFAEQKPYDPNNPDSQPDMPTPPSISLKLGSAMIGFKPDTADYQNGVAAKEMLQPYAADIDDYFEIYPDENIWIIGTTAAVQKGADGSVDLSLRRAEAVKETLIEFGVSKEKLITIGLGAKFPWSVDEFPEGHFDTKVAQANRAVWVLNTSDENEEFNMLKSAYENGALLPAAMDRISQFLR